MLQAKLQDIKPQNFFVIIALAFGLLYVFITPIFQGPDEPSHFFTISRYGNGNLTPYLSEGKITINTHEGVIQRYDNYPGQAGRTSKVGYFDNLNTITSIVIGDFRSGSKQITSSVYPPFNYIHFIVVYFIGAVLKLSPFLLFLSLRLVGLITWISLIYFAIKLIPRAKWLVTVFALLPMSLFVGSIVGADSLVNALVFLIIALITKAIVQPTSLTKKYWVVLLGLIILLGLTKQTFFVVSLLLFALPRPKYVKKISWVLLISAIFILTASFAIGWQILVSPYTSIPFENVSPSSQLRLIIEKPIWFGRVLWNTYLTTYSSQLYIGFIGVLGWLNISLPVWITGGWLALIISSLNSGIQKTKVRLSKFQKLLFIFVALTLAGLLTVALYLVWTPVGAGVVNGLQGRYFIPIIAILLPLFILNRTEPTGNRKVIIVFGIIILHIATFLTYISHYIQIL